MKNKYEIDKKTCNKYISFVLMFQNDASRRIMSSAKSGTLLPDFPSPSQLVLPNNVEMCKVSNF